MHKVSRSLLLAGVLAFGTLAAACGDKVELTQVNPVTGVTAISVTPQSATLNAGQSIQLAVSVTADQNTAKTVTWSSSNSAVATVDQTGKVNAIAAGTASILATSTANTSMAAGSVITVNGASTPTPAGIAISSVTAGNTLTPVNLANVAGQVDVTLFVSGPAGTVRLIQNCTTGGATSSTGDVVVAQQQFAGSQNQTPVVLSYNTAATGTVASGIAAVDNTVATPISVNGNCVMKAQLVGASGTLASAANITPFTLNNTNFFRPTVSFTKTTPAAFGAAQNAISATNGLRYDQGDLTVAFTPVIYTTNAGVTTAQVPALASVNFAGRVFTNVAPTAGKFSVTFPSTGATAQNINEYTSAPAGDNVVVTAISDAAGQPITLGQNVVNATCSSAINCTINPIRVDNQSPTASGTLAQDLSLFTTARNYINGAYSFATNNTPQTDAAFAATQMTTSFYVGALANANTTGGPAIGGQDVALGAQTITESSANCSITGLTKVSTGAELAQSTGNFAPGYFVRVIESDPLGNSVCQDFSNTNSIAGFGVDLQNPNTPSITGATNGATSAGNSVITTGATVSYFSLDSVSGFNPGSELRVTSVRNFTTNAAASCVIGTFASSNCGPANSGYNVIVDNGSGTQAYYTVNVQARDQAGNLSTAVARTYLLDNTIPTVGGVAIPQSLAGGQSVTFTSQANDNVDLQSSNFSLLYSAASGAASLYYNGDNYGPNYDATRVTSSALNATVPFFIKQLQGETAGGVPVAFAAGVGADSGKAQSVTVRAIDAANLISAPVAAGIPQINIANSTGFTAGTQFNTFVVSGPAAINVSNAATPGTTTTSVPLTAQAVFNGATAQQINVPFSQVCFFYQQTAAGNAANPAIPTGDLVSLGCQSAPSIADVANTSRTWTYTLGSAFNPPPELGTAGTINVYAVGVNAAGVGVITPANANITLIP